MQTKKKLKQKIKKSCCTEKLQEISINRFWFWTLILVCYTYTLIISDKIELELNDFFYMSIKLFANTFIQAQVCMI